MGIEETVYKNFRIALESGFVDYSAKADDRYTPCFLTNDAEQAVSLLSVIQQQLADCNSFDFSVAFITADGLTPLLETLSELSVRGIKGRLLTTTYNNFNRPEVLAKLLEFPQIETRVYQGGFHAKGYLFNKDDVSTLIIGSSNLTQRALRVNKEWNILVHSFDRGGILQAARSEFEVLWNAGETVVLTRDWIKQYSEYLSQNQSQAKPVPSKAFVLDAQADVQIGEIVPNAMQKAALVELSKIHEAAEPRAMLISATGTGKTYLSALDVRAVMPKRVLFIAHREKILDSACKSFQRVLGDRYSYSIYKSGCPRPSESCVFAMVETLRRHLAEFHEEEFDYIIVDEAHHVGAGGYQHILNYFRPSFCMGMTATPNRGDGYDVFALFNHCIAYRITLQDALESDLLVPFHYFGIADLEIDDSVLEGRDFSKLTSDERVRHVTEKIEQYSIEKAERRGLIFCSRRDEMQELSKKFNERGYRTVALSGDDSDEARKREVRRLESGEIQYILTVDIFNEGVDIPSLNQIIMLRRTESAIVFIQQLGRGLRKHESKEFTLVLDFIGNYRNNFFVPIALSGDRTFNKDNLRRFVKEGNAVIPGCSTISFDRISEKRIMRAIDEGRFSEARLLKAEYENLKQELGRIPRLSDFDIHGAIDPLLFIDKYGSYYEFLKKNEKSYTYRLSQNAEEIIRQISKRLASGKRAAELMMLKEILLTGQYCISLNDANSESAFNVLEGSFSGLAACTVLVERSEKTIYASRHLEEALQDNEFRHLLLETVEFGLERNRRMYSATYKETQFVLYAKYTYEEVCRLLNWRKEINAQNIGGYKYDADTNTFPVFINYEKDPDIEASINYEDRFVSDKELIALSKQPRYMDSPEIVRLTQWPDNNMRVFLFVRKNKDDGDGGKEFYFLGEMHPTGQYNAVVLRGTNKNAVEITYELDVPVRADIYDYITNPLDR